MSLEVLGVTLDGEIAYRFSPDGEIEYLTADDLGVLTREIQRDTIPIYPTRPCWTCGTDAVVVIEGQPMCEADAAGFLSREEEGTR